MKIGKFAVDNNLTLDTVRHYMDLGLLIPEKKDGYYYFDEKCSEDAHEIISLKEHGFKLSEILDILYIKRLTNPILYEKNKYYMNIYQNKHEQVIKEINILKDIECRLKDKIQVLSDKEFHLKHNVGVDISAIKLLACPSCKSDLALLKGDIKENQIISGVLKCKCGRVFQIEDGILISDNSVHMKNPFEDNSDDFFQSYFKETNTEYIQTLMKDFKWLFNRIENEILENEVLLDLGVGYGIVLRKIYNILLSNNIYIAVDHNLSILRSLKNMLERIDCKKKVFLICSDFLDIPIKNNSIDIVIDVGGTSVYNTKNNKFLLQHIDRLANKKTTLLGLYVISNSFIEKSYGNNFVLNTIKSAIKGLNYNIFDDRISKTISNTGKYESKLLKNEKSNNYLCLAKRQG